MIVSHDDYGKAVLRAAAKDRLVGVDVKTGDPSLGIRIDGVVDPGIAVEVESAAGKRVRAACLDLILSEHPMKLLVLIPAFRDTTILAARSETILARFVGREAFRVVALEGTDSNQRPRLDSKRVAAAINDLTISGR